MLLRENKLITITNPFDLAATRAIIPLAYDPGRTVGDMLRRADLGPQAVAVVNGTLCEDTTHRLLPGDIVHVYPAMQDDALKSVGMIALAVVAFYVVGPAVTGYMAGAGLSSTAAAMWGTVASMATVTAGGMLLNSMLSTPVSAVSGSGSQQKESPTYGWTAQNTAREGLTIPVIYGNVVTYPQIINQWIEVVGNDQWYHSLLSIGEGQTNNVPTQDDVFIDDQPITILPEDSYVIDTTDGSGSPPSVLTNHERLHQLRPINKELIKTTLSQVLMHFNGTEGSQDIIDDGVGVADDPETTEDTTHVNTWTAHNTADLSTAHPFLGTASLDLETGGDYISCDEPLALDIWKKDAWDFECRFRQDALTDAAIIGQQRVVAGGNEYYWGIFYIGGSLVFQQYIFIYSSSSYLVYFNCSQAVSLSVDTWHHIRVARDTTYDDEVFDSATIYFFLDGVLLGSGGHTNTPVDPPAGTWEQTIGKAQYYTGSSDSAYYGNCELDELRLYAYGHIYDLDGFTPPTNPLADDGEQTFFTRGVIDRFTVTVQCPYGLYKTDPDGTLHNGEVGMWVSFRKVGATNWVRYFVDIWTKSRNPVTRQFAFAPSAGRGLYEIRVSRLHWWNAEEFGYEHLFQTTAYLTFIDEILDEALRYPHLQLAAVSIKAQDKISGRIPTIGIESNRTSITVPDYDGGGTRMVNPTNNAHAAFDLLTNQVYSVGIEPARIIQSDWEAWQNWCDATIDGSKRCQINMVFDAEYDMDEALAHVEACGRAKVVMRGTQFSAVIEKPGSACGLFNQANIVPGSNKLRWIRTEEKSDAVEITYRDAASRTDKTAFAPGTGFYSLVRVPRVTRLNILGINNGEQALREAIFRQQISESINRSVEFQTGLEGISVTPGDIIDWGHGGNELVFSGRLVRGSSREEEYTGTTVYLDEEITLPSATFSGNCILIVRDPDDTVRQYTVSGPFDTPTRAVWVSASGTFNFLAPWIILRGSGEIYQYRITQMARSSNQDVRLTGVQYAATAYYNSNYASGVTPI